ncbi:TIR domain-containing protein [Actinoplanes sp. NEAU-A12]|uniref:TIR domain-containing protein n=1 Tax=Actinoplanes sandaracinus TaxID=3045177 RepID=A0ABT6WPG6_9ACTN|nr:TIR domain-containing protein [Actinoplanes sandaracinus]MDI6101651.1 TIR domain-containing protein [Actinoplanes sandaracinus]
MTVSYNGFISYSHAADGRLAPAVQRGLHHLAKPWNRRRALWIFRDQTGLSVTPALWSSIQRAIDGSDYFVLMASPEAARSPWVNREIEHWVATKSADKILPVVTDGEWLWDRRARDFDEASTAVPPALRGVFDEEPLHLDLRWARDDQHLSLRHSRFRDAIAQLAAPMHGVSKDDLEGEDVRQHRRAGRLRLAAVSSLALLALLASVTGVFAVQNAARANASAIEARRQQQEASVQRGSAAKFADQAQRQQELAEAQEARARDAAAEAQTQLGRADSAAARAREQERLAQRQNALARESAKEMRRQQQRAEQQAEIARQQQKLAREAGAEARQQEEIAKEQERLANEAAAEARKQEKIAKEQERLANEAAAEARKQEKIAKEQEQRAKDAKAEAEQEKANAAREKANAAREKENAAREQANASQQQRIAISRRLVNEAKATLQDEPQTAMRLGIAAQKIYPEAETRREVANLITSTRYAGSIDDVAAVEHGPDSLLITLGKVGVVSLWNVSNRADPVRLATIGDPGPLNNRMSLSKDGKSLSVVRDGVAQLWDVSDPSRPAIITTLPADRRYNSAVFSPDGRTLVTGDRTGRDGYATLWDVTDRGRPKQLSTLEGSSVSGDDFAFSADGRTLVDGNGDTHIWDVTDPAAPVARATINATYTNFSMALSPTAPLLAVGNGLGELTLYDIDDTANPVQTARLQYDNETLMLSLAFSADGSVLASGDHDGRTILWQMGAYPRQIGDMPGVGGIESLAFSSDGRTLVTADSADTAVLWNTTEFAAPRHLSAVAAHTDRLLALSYGSDGRSMTTLGADGAAAFWDVTDRERPVQRATVPIPGLTAFGRAVISPDGRTIANSAAEGVVNLTDVSDPAKPSAPATVRTGVSSPSVLAFSPDGRTFVIGGAGKLELWDLPGGAAATRLTTLTFTTSSVGEVVFSPDGRTMAVSAIQTVSLWDVTNRAAPKQLSVLSGHGNTVLAVRFSPDGTKVLTGSFDHTAILWDVSDPAKPRRLTTLTGHTYKVGAVAFSQDGKTVATAEDGSWAVLWDVSQPSKPVRLARVKIDQYHTPTDMAFSSDGSTLVVGTDHGWTGHIALWDLSELNRLRADPAAVGCTVTGRGLTPQEWAREIPELPYQVSCPG